MIAIAVLTMGSWSLMANLDRAGVCYEKANEAEVKKGERQWTAKELMAMKNVAEQCLAETEDENLKEKFKVGKKRLKVGDVRAYCQALQTKLNAIQIESCSRTKIYFDEEKHGRKWKTRQKELDKNYYVRPCTEMPAKSKYKPFAKYKKYAKKVCPAGVIEPGDKWRVIPKRGTKRSTRSAALFCWEKKSKSWSEYRNDYCKDIDVIEE